MKIARAITVLARARAEGTKGDPATAAITYAGSLAISHPATVERIAGGKATVRMFDDGSFLMIGSLALPMMGELQVISGDARPTLAQVAATFEETIADALIAQAMEQERERAKREAPSCPTGEVPRGHWSMGEGCVCPCPLCTAGRAGGPK